MSASGLEASDPHVSWSWMEGGGGNVDILGNIARKLWPAALEVQDKSFVCNVVPVHFSPDVNDVVFMRTYLESFAT